MKPFILFLSLSVVLFSCQKQVDFDSPQGGGGNGNGGTYQPVSKNSYWKYHETGSYSGDYIITSTGEKRTQNGIDYFVFSAAPATSISEELLGVNGHNLYQFFEGQVPNSTAGISLNMLYSNDTASVGYTWDNMAGQANGLTAYTPGTILEKNISLTVGSKTYSNVIHSQIELQYDFPIVGIVNAATYDYYIAKGIGMIRIVTVGDPNFLPGVSTNADLVEYSIK
jgi:hypothetical protein